MLRVNPQHQKDAFFAWWCGCLTNLEIQTILYTLSPIIMEVENHPLQIFHFHDYGRKGNISCWQNPPGTSPRPGFSSFAFTARLGTSLPHFDGVQLFFFFGGGLLWDLAKFNLFKTIGLGRRWNKFEIIETCTLCISSFNLKTTSDEGRDAAVDLKRVRPIPPANQTPLT